MSHPASARLLLDEMFSPAIAAALRDLGQDVIAVAERGELRAMSDDDVLYTSSRAFPRSRKNPGPLIQAIQAWMLNGPPEAPLTEDWLLNPATR